MEKAMEQRELSVQELIAELEKPFVAQKPQADPGKLGAKASLMASVASLTAIDSRAGYLLNVVLPQVFEFLELFHQQPPEAAKLASDIPGKTWRIVEEILVAGIVKMQTSQSQAIKRAVHLAELRFRLNPDLGLDEAQKGLDWAVLNQFICADGKVSDRFGFTDEDKKEIGTVLAIWKKKGVCLKFSEPVVPEPVSPPAPKPKASNGKITARQAWAGELGKFKLTIPANGGNKKPCVLEMESQDGGFLFVAKAGNGFADLENQAIPLSAIQIENGQIREGLRLNAPPMPEDRLSKWQSQMERLGTTLQRGFAAVLEEESREVSPKEFLEGAVGTSVLTYHGMFEWQFPSREICPVESPVLCFSRTAEGKVGLVKIISSEPESEKLFSEAVGIFHDPGEAFKGMRPQQISSFLRAVFRQVVVEG